MNTPLISVIVPVYNVAEYLPRSLESIINQSYKNLEILLINDGSTDNSGDICEDFAKKDERIKIISQENSGVSSARNAGIDYAKGEWFGFVDSDDWIEPNMFEKLLYAAQKSKSKIVVCGHNDYRGNIAKTKKAITSSGLIEQTKAIEHLLAYDGFEGYLWNKLFCKDLITELRLDTDIHFCEDVLFSAKAFMRTVNIYYFTDILYHHCLNEDSAMLSFSEKRLTELKAWERTADVLENLSPKLAKIARCRYANAAITLYYYTGYSSENLELKRKLKKEANRYFALYMLSKITSVSLKFKGAIKLLFPQLKLVIDYFKTK